MSKNLNTITISFTILVIVLLSYLLYKNYYQEGLIGYYGEPQIFNFGTRQWAPTHLMSYDVRGDVPIGYYPIGIFNEPENLYGRKHIYRNAPGFYTPTYVNPFQGMYPSMYNSTFSVPFKVNANNGPIANTSWQVKPVLDNPN